ncbi:sugar nucleotide-binding protein [Micromonospora sp. HNM0581]|uniref:sugar nucleotide-binding protein n=1 Tax=Micromonospora sp. HNM0581 TaxID=2716341 RepID=UPI00146D4D18|nr:sugar nucleotide-binding protein [Micromonospora sp. HNM0581]NLU77771.1 sugar nucleotide-binding protein [Micromonospora sp. HNM0581]
MTSRILITGTSGHLGRRVAVRAAAAGWQVIGTYHTTASGPADHRLDIRDLSAVRDTVRCVCPDVVVHTAAGREDWHAVADGAAHVARAAADVGARLVHVSSDALFSGKDVYYDEGAAPDPVYYYGSAKAAAETAVRAVAPAAAIVRTSLIVGDGQSAHEALVHRLVSGDADAVLFTDEVRAPIHVDDLADALLELAAEPYSGILNVAGADAVSRYELGVLIARHAGLDSARLSAGTVKDLCSPRPTDVRLRIDRARSVLRTRLRGVREFMGSAAAGAQRASGASASGALQQST